MTFDISRAIDSSIALGGGASSQSQFDINAKEAITSVVKEFASQLFDDAQFMSEMGLKLLNSFQSLKVDDQEFTEKTTSLEEQLSVVAHLCHSRNLKAHKEKRELTADEKSEISQAFANLSVAHASDKELSAKLAILEEAAPTLTKVSEAYVNYILPFDTQLSELLEGIDLPQNVKDSVVSYRNDFFPESSCTRDGLEAIVKAEETPDFATMKYEDCVKAFSNHILHIALEAKNENREMNESEVQAIKDAIKALRRKMGLMRESKIKTDRMIKVEEALEKTIRDLAQLPIDQKEKTRELSQKITGLETDLRDFNYYTAYVAKFEDMQKAITNGKKRRNKALTAEKRALVDYTKECVQRQKDLQHAREAQKKQIEKYGSEWEAFVEKKYADPSLIERDIQVQDNMYFRVGFLLENPEVVAQAAMLFIDHLTSKVNRLPQEEQSSSWFSLRIWG